MTGRQVSLNKIPLFKVLQYINFYNGFLYFKQVEQIDGAKRISFN